MWPLLVLPGKKFFTLVELGIAVLTALDIGMLIAAVVAKPDAKWGEAPCAFVELKPGHADVVEADLIAFCRDNLARFKCPKHVVFCELPKTTTGKIQKFRLREQAKALD
jgi:fatty-acyl-CoA synthase